MTASQRLVVTVALGLALSFPTAALVCAPLDLSGPWLAVVMAVSGPFWAWMTDRGIGDGSGCSTLAASDATLEEEDHGA